MPTPKPVAGAILDKLSFPKVGGGDLSVGGTKENWTLFVVYRGKHCPRCKKYLNILDGMRDQWADAGFDIAVVSADTAEKAEAEEEKKEDDQEREDLHQHDARTLGAEVHTEGLRAVVPA